MVDLYACWERETTAKQQVYRTTDETFRERGQCFGFDLRLSVLSVLTSWVFAFLFPFFVVFNHELRLSLLVNYLVLFLYNLLLPKNGLFEF